MALISAKAYQDSSNEKVHYFLPEDVKYLTEREIEDKNSYTSYRIYKTVTAICLKDGTKLYSSETAEGISIKINKELKNHE